MKEFKEFIFENLLTIISVIIVIALMTPFCIVMHNAYRYHEQNTQIVEMVVTDVKTQEIEYRVGEHHRTKWDLTVSLRDANGKEAVWNWEVIPDISLQTIDDFEWLKVGQKVVAECSKDTGKVFRIGLPEESQ